jgi:hypothetical protein
MSKKTQEIVRLSAISRKLMRDGRVGKSAAAKRVKVEGETAPRYKLGDKAWLILNNKPTNITVKAIMLSDLGFIYSETPFQAQMEWIYERTLFATKEELIASL